MAEEEGFEPSLGFRPKHTFQACAFNHSAIPPKNVMTSYPIFFKRSIFIFICLRRNAPKKSRIRRNQPAIEYFFFVKNRNSARFGAFLFRHAQNLLPLRVPEPIANGHPVRRGLSDFIKLTRFPSGIHERGRLPACLQKKAQGNHPRNREKKLINRFHLVHS